MTNNKQPESTEENLTPEQRILLDKLRLFMAENADRVNQWYKAHAPSVPRLPVYWDALIEGYIWMNRDQRRRMAKNGKRKKS